MEAQMSTLEDLEATKKLRELHKHFVQNMFEVKKPDGNETLHDILNDCCTSYEDDGDGRDHWNFGDGSFISRDGDVYTAHFACDHP